MSKEIKKPGRKPKSPEDAKNVRITFLATPSFAEQINKEAKECGLSLSAFICTALTEKIKRSHA